MTTWEDRVQVIPLRHLQSLHATAFPELGLLGLTLVHPPQRRGALCGMVVSLSPLIRFGTSTWTYEGWQGQVYKRQYAKSAFEVLGG